MSTERKNADDWVLDGGSIALDLVNTVRDRAIGARETLPAPSALERWLAFAGLPSEDAVDERLLDAARSLRTALDALLSPGGAPRSGDARLVNAWARRAPALQLDESAPAAIALCERSVEQCLGLIAAEAIALIADGETDRIRICAHERCGLRYLDRSRGRRRRWCSMERCGNRTKAARHAAGRRAG